MRTKKIFIFMLLLMMLVVMSCHDQKPSEIVFPASGISYNRTVQPLFNLACNSSGCHEAATAAGGLDLSTYYGTRYSKSGVVIPYDTVSSRLIWSIEGRLGTQPMPPGGVLTTNQIQGLRKWIMEGATDSIP
jgi:hypothetical protein